LYQCTTDVIISLERLVWYGDLQADRELEHDVKDMKDDAKCRK